MGSSDGTAAANGNWHRSNVLEFTHWCVHADGGDFYDPETNSYDLSGVGPDEDSKKRRAAAAQVSPATEKPAEKSEKAAPPQSEKVESEKAAPGDQLAQGGVGEGTAVVPAPATEPTCGMATFANRTAEFLLCMQTLAVGSKKSLPAIMADLFTRGPALKTAVTKRIPWDSAKGYTTFLRAPTGDAKGHAHVVMLDFGENAYPGGGAYVADAITMLQCQHADLGRGVRVAPKSAQANLGCFGWAPDGDIANGARAFALSAMALYSVLGHWQPDANPWSDAIQSAIGGVRPWGGDVPEAVKALLADLTAMYRAHGNATARVVANLVDSAIGHKINRSIEDPTFLSKEMLRCNISQDSVKTVMTFYKQRCLANPALHLKESVEEATLRFMEYDKVAVGTQAAIAAHVREKTWQRCVFTCQSFMASHFVVGAKLGSWLETFLSKQAVQTAEGQTLAVACAIAQTPPGTTISKQVFGELCATCGLWILIRDRVLPELAIGSAMVEQLAAEFQSTNMDGALHKSIRALRSVEPDAAMRNFGDLAAWVMAHVSAVRACQQTMANDAARRHDGTISAHEYSISNFQFCQPAVGGQQKMFRFAHSAEAKSGLGGVEACCGSLSIECLSRILFS